jgi:hypothetical protein
VTKRELIISKFVHGSTAGGHCSVCQKSFEVSYTESDTPAGARQKLTSLFQTHTCTEDVSPAGSQL